MRCASAGVSQASGGVLANHDDGGFGRQQDDAGMQHRSELENVHTWSFVG